MSSPQCGAESVRRSLSRAIVEAVADREGVDATEIEPPRYDPLYTVVDPEALDSLFAPTLSGAVRALGSVSFEYAGYDVTVFADGQVELAERAPTGST